MSDVILSVTDLKAAFDTESGRIRAVDKVGFTLRRGRTLGLVGESGCGKSVTALCILRLLPKPSGVIESGSITFKGTDILALPARDLHTIRGKRISMIFQEPMTALNPVHRISMQMREVYDLHFPDLSSRAIAAQSLEMLKKVGIANPEKVLSRYPHQLSGGMRQRVMIAMALSAKPDILIADEPTTALDVTVQAQILELIRSLQKEIGMAVILITHDLGVIAENCDDAVVMYGGQVSETAPVERLFAEPRHPYTRGLLKSIPSLARKPKSLLPTISGMVPPLEEMPSGCRFSTRCPKAQAVCNTRFPDYETVGPDHRAACFFLEEHGA